LALPHPCLGFVTLDFTRTELPTTGSEPLEVEGAMDFAAAARNASSSALVPSRRRTVQVTPPRSPTAVKGQTTVRATSSSVSAALVDLTRVQLGVHSVGDFDAAFTQSESRWPAKNP
jgi:hypothetical protein